ncbi:antitoxin Xre/MbcA/ParS toxin-binding domain-containing protein [Marinobacter sp. M1N3S26]
MSPWMKTENRQLGSRPIDSVTTTEGLGQITAYLGSLTL